MEKKIYACTAALFLSAAALAACSGQSGAAAQTQSIAAGQETQSIAAGQETVTAGSQDTALNVTPETSAETQTPAAGDSVEIAAQPSTAASAFISEADAKKTAFDHAGVTEADVTGLRVKLDYDDGRQVYDVEFYSGNQEYDYEISAVDGTILSYDNEMEFRGGPNQQTSSQAGAAAISEEEAKQAAFAHAGVTEADVTGLRVRLDYDDGRQVYDVEFYAGSLEYDYEISAADGTVLSFDQEMDDWARAQNSASAAQGAGTNAASGAAGSLSEADAKALALSQVPGAAEENIVKFGQDYDDGRSVYEIEIRYEYAEYEIEIDAATGDIVKMEKD